jgi:DNA repair protein RAD57
LFVQLPRERRGLKGSTCYLVTSSKLPTTRLTQIYEAHPLLFSSVCGLQNIHTISTPTIPVLIRVLTETLPPFVIEQSKGHNPVKLLVIDALAELFHTSNKTTTNTLVERSRNISEISTLLHSLASTHQIAILVINEVVDVFNRDHLRNIGQGDLSYSDQSRWFSRMNSVPGEDKKEASLGLVWANQVNVRVLLSRTGRRRYLDDSRLPKRHRSEGQPPHSASVFDMSHDDQSTLVRRLSVVFNSVSQHPVSMDYIVTEQGISTLPGDEVLSSGNELLAPPSSDHAAAVPVCQSTSSDPRTQISPLDVGIAEEGRNTVKETVKNLGELDSDEDDWEKYWTSNEILGDIHGDAHTDILKTRSPMSR